MPIARRTRLPRRRAALLAPAAGLALAALAACGDGSSSSTIAFVAEGEDMIAYDQADGRRQVVISGNEDESDPDIPAVNGQICFAPDGSGRFVIGDDAAQPDPPPGWSIIQLEGERVGELSARRLTKLTPSYQGGLETADPYGCAYLSDGRILTTDIGNNASGPASGQLIVWFPSAGGGAARYCKLDVEIGTAGGIFVDADDRVHVASARVDPGVLRYDPPFPTGDDAAGGCGRRDATGAPLADSVRKEKLIAANADVPIANGVVGAPGGHFYVSSVINGVIGEFDASGRFLRRILEPPAGEKLGPTPFSTGSPLGIAIDAHGTVYYADLGLVLQGTFIGPGRRLGSVRRIRFQNGSPLPPETLESGLAFPDGVGVLER